MKNFNLIVVFDATDDVRFNAFLDLVDAMFSDVSYDEDSDDEYISVRIDNISEDQMMALHLINRLMGVIYDEEQ